jgi:hypothetical protein
MFNNKIYPYDTNYIKTIDKQLVKYLLTCIMMSITIMQNLKLKFNLYEKIEIINYIIE